MRVCNFRVWNVSPMIGFLGNYPPLAQQQPVGTEAFRAQALARWRTFPHFVDTEIENLREGVRAGYFEPKINVTRVIASADALPATTPTASPFYAPAKKDSTLAFRQAFEQLVGEGINPAVRRYRDYLAKEYLPVARANVSITANPNGTACNAHPFAVTRQWRFTTRFSTSAPTCREGRIHDACDHGRALWNGRHPRSDAALRRFVSEFPLARSVIPATEPSSHACARCP